MAENTSRGTSNPSGGGASRNQNPGNCSGRIDRTAPAGSPNSLGAESDCNGRPTTDDSVVEAKDEMPPLGKPENR